MTDTDITYHHDMLDIFFDSIATGEPIPNELAFKAWLSWCEIDKAVEQACHEMNRAIIDLETELSNIRFERLPAKGMA